MTSSPRSPDLIETLAGIVGAGHVLSAPADTAPFVTDWRGRYRGAARCVVRPANTGEVAAVVKACAAAGWPFVARGAGTGLSGGAVALGGMVVIEMARMNRVLELDIENRVACVEPGVVNLHLSRPKALGVMSQDVVFCVMHIPLPWSEPRY